MHTYLENVNLNPGSLISETTLHWDLNCHLNPTYYLKTQISTSKLKSHNCLEANLTPTLWPGLSTFYVFTYLIHLIKSLTFACKMIYSICLVYFWTFAVNLIFQGRHSPITDYHTLVLWNQSWIIRLYFGLCVYVWIVMVKFNKEF